MSQSVKSSIQIETSPEQVYLSFTRSLLLRQWLCDFATVTPRPGGRMYLWWNGDFYSAGEYLSLEENRSIKFKWHARFDPVSTEVLITITPKDKKVEVTLEHIVPDGEDWRKRAQGFKDEWDSTLPNLASLLETGLDRRIYDRPMLGIQISDFNNEIARSIGIPVSSGIRLAETVEGMGAQAAGLTCNDVIVQFDGKPITNDFSSLALALQGKKGGDQVEVVFYRGQEKRTVTMLLSKRQVPDIPGDPKELARQVQAKNDQGFKLIEEALSGTKETELNHNPGPGEWNAMQTLAHLVQSERGRLENLIDLVGGYERNGDDWGGNLLVHINATVAAHGSTVSMINEIKRLSTEVVEFIANLPTGFVSWKCNYLNLGNNMLTGNLSHIQGHVEQIKKAIASARK